MGIHNLFLSPLFNDRVQTNNVGTAEYRFMLNHLNVHLRVFTCSRYALVTDRLEDVGVAFGGEKGGREGFYFGCGVKCSK